MSNYMTKAAAHARLLKLASAARLIRRQRALQKYAQAVQMQKLAADAAPPALKGPGGLSGTAKASLIGSGLGALVGGGLGYGFGKKDRKLLAALLGAGGGAALGAGGGALYHRLTRDRGIPISPNDPIASGTLEGALAQPTVDMSETLGLPQSRGTLAGPVVTVPNGTERWGMLPTGTISLTPEAAPNYKIEMPMEGSLYGGQLTPKATVVPPMEYTPGP